MHLCAFSCEGPFPEPVQPSHDTESGLHTTSGLHTESGLRQRPHWRLARLCGACRRWCPPVRSPPPRWHCTRRSARASTAGRSGCCHRPGDDDGPAPLARGAGPLLVRPHGPRVCARPGVHTRCAVRVQCLCRACSAFACAPAYVRYAYACARPDRPAVRYAYACARPDRPAVRYAYACALPDRTGVSPRGSRGPASPSRSGSCRPSHRRPRGPPSWPGPCRRSRRRWRRRGPWSCPRAR